MTSFEGYIMSPAFSSYEDASAHYARTVGEQAYPVSVYKNKGAATVKEFCKILYEEAVSEGVCPEVLYAQVMKETGYLKFGNLVKADNAISVVLEQLVTDILAILSQTLRKVLEPKSSI